MTTPTQTGDKPMVTPELLPCPFCGDDEFLILSNTLMGENSFWGVECGCHVFGPTATLRAEAIAAWNTRAQETLSPEQAIDVERAFALGQRVGKIKGSNWQGRVVGFYSTALTPVGYAVESEREPGSVQIYPESALAALSPPTSGEEMRLRDEENAALLADANAWYSSVQLCGALIGSTDETCALPNAHDGVCAALTKGAE